MGGYRCRMMMLWVMATADFVGALAAGIMGSTCGLQIVRHDDKDVSRRL